MKNQSTGNNKSGIIMILGDSREIEAIINALKHQELMRRSHRRIKSACGKISGEGVTILAIEQDEKG